MAHTRSPLWPIHCPPDTSRRQRSVSFIPSFYPCQPPPPRLAVRFLCLALSPVEYYVCVDVPTPLNSTRTKGSGVCCADFVSPFPLLRPLSVSFNLSFGPCPYPQPSPALWFAFRIQSPALSSAECVYVGVPRSPVYLNERTKALTFAAPIRLIPLKSKLYILSLCKFLCLSELFLSSSTHTNDRGKTDRRAMIRMMTMVVMMTKKRRQKVAAYTEIQILNLLTPTRPDNAMPSTLGRATSQENVIVPVPDDVMISPHVDPHGTSR